MKTIIAALMVSLMTASSTLAVTIYSQPWDGGVGAQAYSSQNATGGSGNFATAYDNFTLGANSAIGNVSWTGAWFNPPTQGTITGFTISFWADSAGQPGGLLQSYAIAGNASETFVGSSAIAEFYSYSANLGPAFNALAGIEYWLSIVAITNTDQPQWGWATGTGGDGIAYSEFFGTRDQVPSDLAFTLDGTSGNGNAVPESGATALLLGGTIIGLGLLRKKFSVARS